jgi:hypothetical protein
MAEQVCKLVRQIQERTCSLVCHFWLKDNHAKL